MKTETRTKLCIQFVTRSQPFTGVVLPTLVGHIMCFPFVGKSKPYPDPPRFIFARSALGWD